MSNKKKRTLNFDWPIIDGSISTAMAKCGQKNCKCHTDPKALHGPCYRWIGNIDGKKTTRTITKEMAQECRRWNKNYEKLQQQITQLLMGIKKIIAKTPQRSELPFFEFASRTPLILV